MQTSKDYLKRLRFQSEPGLSDPSREECHSLGSRLTTFSASREGLLLVKGVFSAHQLNGSTVTQFGLSGPGCPSPSSSCWRGREEEPQASAVWCTALPCSGVRTGPKPRPLETLKHGRRTTRAVPEWAGLSQSHLPGPTTQMPAAPMVFVLPGPIFQFFFKPQGQPCIFTINSFSSQANQSISVLVIKWP